jgi:hypothetical protein
MTTRRIRTSFYACFLAALLGSGACATRGDSGAPAPERASTPTTSPAGTSATLAAAHEAYLTGDFVGMGERIRETLLDPAASPSERENALALLDKAYEKNAGKLPSRFVLPAQVENVKLAATFSRSRNDTHSNVFLWMQVQEGFAAHVSSMTVRRLPSETLLDMKAGPGRLAVQHHRPGFEDLVLEATNITTAPADGVYAIHVGLDDGREVDGWVVGRGLAASATPEVLSPAPSTVIAGPHPEVTWKPFTSPQYAAFEQRSLSVYVHDEGRQKTAWDYWVANPGDLGSVRIGSPPGAPVGKLEPGTYWLALTASEERKFGPVRLSRSSQTGVPFHVTE